MARLVMLVLVEAFHSDHTGPPQVTARSRKVRLHGVVYRGQRN